MNEDVPPITYATQGDLSIAYQVVGSGPIDIVWVPGLIGHLELEWEDPRTASLYRRLASFARLIKFDKRGTGLSDRDVGTPTLEQRMDDVRIVMDAAGSERAVIFGMSEGGPMSILFAATYPERTAALVLFGTFARVVADDGYEGWDRAAIELGLAQIVARWGTGASLHMFARDAEAHPKAVERMARLERGAASPSSARAMWEAILQIDVRPILASITVPTLVVTRLQDHAALPSQGRYLAANIPGAQHLEQAGEHLPGGGDIDELADAIQAFATGERAVAPIDRVLATIVFTDIVGSTELATRLGDRRWRSLLDEHDAIIGTAVGRYQGRVVKNTGDGALASFDGPGRAIACACEIRESVRSLGIDMRTGIHTGEVELRGQDLGGIAVHIGARIGALAADGEVLVSRTVKDLVVGSGVSFQDRGAHALKGIPDQWQLYAVTG